MLASDAVESKIRFPCIIMPKIDGVRGLSSNGTLTGRSLKTHKNKYATKFFSSPILAGLDGEMAAHEDCCKDDLCRITSSALSTISGEPNIVWWLFDFIDQGAVNEPYKERVRVLAYHVDHLIKAYPALAPHLKLVPWMKCDGLDNLLAQEQLWLEMGYEGLIIRNPEAVHKEGRSTVREGGLLRIKRFIEEEAVVLRLIEGETNNNEKQTNELGRSFRSSHQENKTPNGMLATMECAVLKDIPDPYTKGKILFAKDQIITVNAGCMTHEERIMYWEHPEMIVNHIIKFKFFPKGIKDKPRFPNFQAIRGAADIG